MNWLTRALAQLADNPCCGYSLGQSTASETTALAALALLGHGRTPAAQPALAWLAETQQEDGSLSIRHGDDAPGWPTPWAMLAWESGYQANDNRLWKEAADRGGEWLLSVAGNALEPDGTMGHNVRLVGWSWAAGTHSWLEPTATSIIGLNAIGRGDHARVREGVQLLIDRQLPGGGCNYGNTFVLGNKLRPHVQPSGIAAVALANETDASGRLPRTLAYLRRNVTPRTTTMSLAWAVLGLAAHGNVPKAADALLAERAERTLANDRSPFKLALLALAALKSASPVVASHANGTEKQAASASLG